MQLAIAWVLAKGDFIVPVIGARTRAQLSESLAALNLPLSPEEIAAVEAGHPGRSCGWEPLRRGADAGARQREVEMELSPTAQQKGLMPLSPISPKIPSRLVSPSISFTRGPRLMSCSSHFVRLQAT